MKLILVVLLAGIWSATAAPQSTPNFSFEEYELDLPIFDNFNQVRKVLKCVQTAINGVVEEKDLGSVWDETEAKIDQSVSVEWPKCASITNKYSKLKCQATVARNVVDAINIFVKYLANLNKWELVKEIKEKVLTSCFNSQGGPIETGNKIEQFQAPALDNLLPRFECAARGLDEVSEALSLQSLWEKSKPQLEHHLVKWKQCQQVENAVFRYLCEIKEGGNSFIIVTDYLKLATSQEPKFLKSFNTYFEQHCTGKSFADELADMFAVEEDELAETFVVDGLKAYVEKLVQNVKCITEAVTESVHGTDFEAVWAQARSDLIRLRDKLVRCTSSTETVKCVVETLKESNSLIAKFLKHLKEANVDAYNKIKENIKKKCYKA